jgi:hypothetical protein
MMISFSPVPDVHPVRYALCVSLPPPEPAGDLHAL